MIVREANTNDLNEILQLYLYLHEKSIPDDTEHLRNTWTSGDFSKGESLLVEV